VAAKERVKSAPDRASALMYGADRLPMMSLYERFSMTTTTMWSGRGRPAVAELAAELLGALDDAAGLAAAAEDVSR
jgi:hypothetical protein